MIQYLIIIVALFLLEILYFRIANHFNIIDKPNERSSHTSITLRGGGIIYPLSFLLFVISQNIIGVELSTKKYLFFGLGLLCVSVISFIDDIRDLSTKVRLLFHFIGVSLLLYSIDAFALPIWVILVFYVFVIGILNAFNFMDGINGMTGLYSLVALVSLYFINLEVRYFDNDFIIYPIMASLVFLVFNFRKRAKSFAGDIGSFSIAFWILALIGSFVITTGDYKYILLLSVYGTETILTIIERLRLKENIFDAHRRHLYQLFANEKKQSHLIVSFVYAFIQCIINLVLIQTSYPFYIYLLIIVLPLGLLYIFTKKVIKKGIGA